MSEKKPVQNEEIKDENIDIEEESKVEELSENDKLMKDYADLSDKYMRTLAEYDNFRKRSQKEKDNIAVDARALLLTKLLPVFDNLGRCLANSDTDAETLRKGIEMTVTQLNEILKALGVESYGEPGDEFDPNIHNAVMHTEDESKPENSVTDVFEKGWKLGDRVIRPATVKVVN